MNVCEIVTNNILERLKDAEETGKTFYWVKPFSEGAPRIPFSYGTMVAYSGINRLLLEPDEYLTFNKIKEVSTESEPYHIRKGAKAKIVIYYNTMVEKDKNGEPVIDERTGEPIKRGFLKYYRVYSRQDVVNEKNENLPSNFNFKHYEPQELTEQTAEKINDFHRMINAYCKKYGITIEITKDGTEAYYCPSNDTIRIPSIENFTDGSIYEYVHTLAHEIAHSTMKTLGRCENEKVSKLEDIMINYSKEELVAEISAEMMIQNLGIPDDRANKDNSIAYLQNWAKHLKDKMNEIVSASARAEQACNLVFDCLEPEITRETEKKGEIDDAR